MSELKQRLTAEMKAAMKAGDKARLSTIRMINAAIKQEEIDGQKDISDDDVLRILVKMQKQRKDSLTQYRDAGREDLAVVEETELAVIADFLPSALSTEEVQAIIAQAVSETGAASAADMGKVMALVKPQVQGRADMGQISQLIKAALS